jgi:hypothetical protein
LLASNVPSIKIATFVETEAAEPGPCLFTWFKHPKPKKVTANLADVSAATGLDEQLCDAAN